MLFVSNLPAKITKDQLQKIFNRYANVQKVIQNDETSAYVIYETWKDTLKVNYILKEEKQLKIND